MSVAPLCILLMTVPLVWSTNWDDVNLPSAHIPYYFNSHPNLKAQCHEDVDCPYKVEFLMDSFHVKLND